MAAGDEPPPYPVGYTTGPSTIGLATGRAAVVLCRLIG